MAASGSFEEFYAGTAGRLLGQLFLVTGDLHAAEEIVQEAFTILAVRGGTVKSLLARGRRSLAARLGEPEEVFDRA